jgi:hypothetical protein
MKIATHDSATGERGQGFLSWLVTPFAKTQSKTIKEQYEAGCRMFDIRVKIIKNGWKCAHGLWISERGPYDILKEINDFEEQCYVTLTYEGNKDQILRFSNLVQICKEDFTNIIWGGIGIKYGKDANLLNVKYDYIEPYPKDYPQTERAFLPLDGSSWHILLPIPWLWKKIYHNKVEFNDKVYKYVDFL